MNFAFVSGIKVTPESLFSGLMSSLPVLSLVSCLSWAHLFRKLLCDTQWMKSFPNLLWKVSKGICHLTFTGQSGMSKLKKLIERNTISIPFKRGERNVRAGVLGHYWLWGLKETQPPGILASHLSHKRSLRFLPALTS